VIKVPSTEIMLINSKAALAFRWLIESRQFDGVASAYHWQ
jgi:hypothetical protein